MSCTILEKIYKISRPTIIFSPDMKNYERKISTYQHSLEVEKRKYSAILYF